MQMVQLASHPVKPEISLRLSLRLGSEELVHHLLLAAYSDAFYLSVLSRHHTITSYSLIRSEPRHEAISLHTLVLSNMLAELIQRVCRCRAFCSTHQIRKRHSASKNGLDGGTESRWPGLHQAVARVTPESLKPGFEN